MKAKQRSLLIVLFAICWIFAGCPQDDEDRPPEEFDEIEWDDDQYVFEVQWSDEATVIEEEDLDLVLEADLENHVYRLDAGAVEAAGLEIAPGRVLVIYGTALRRISAVEEADQTLVVTTEFATLPDAIEEGRIAWDYGVEFIPERLHALTLGDQSVAMQDDGHVELQFTHGGYTITFGLELRGDYAVVDVAAAKSGVELSATGTVMRFRSRDSIVIEGGEVVGYETNLDHLRGDLDLALTVAGSGQDFLDFTLPVPLMQFRVPVGGILVTLNVNTQFVINMVVPADGSSQVRAGFTFDSDLGFEFRGVDVEATGNLNFLEMDSDTHQTGASSPISANFGIGFPRVEVAIFGNLVVPWAQVATLIGGSFTVFPPCQTADLALLGAGGLNLAFLKLPGIDLTTTFFREETELLRVGDCPEDPQ